MRVRVPWLRLSEPVSDFSGGSRSDKIIKASTLVGIIGIFAGVYVYSSAALAEVEDGANQEENSAVYSISVLSRGTVSNFPVNMVGNIDRQLEFISPNIPDRFDESVIPEAVWSLDASIGGYSNRISAGFAPETHLTFGGSLESVVFWTSTAADSNDDKSPYSLLPPQKFQVASCGGSSAERSDLDYCHDKDTNSNHDVDSANTTERDPSTSTTPDANNSVTLSNDASSSSQNTQSNFAQLAPLATGLAPRQGNMTFADPCDAAPLSCLIDQPATQLSSTTGAPKILIASVPPPDSPTSFTDDLTPPIDASPPEDSPPPVTLDVLDSPPAPLDQRPIPEASTWTMTVIGFGAFVFIFGVKRKNRVNPISIVDMSEGY